MALLSQAAKSQTQEENAQSKTNDLLFGVTNKKSHLPKMISCESLQEEGLIIVRILPFLVLLLKIREMLKANSPSVQFPGFYCETAIFFSLE